MSRDAPGSQAFDFDGLRGTEREATYSGIRSFCRRPLTRDLDGVDWAVFGIPCDITVSSRPGCRYGPSRLREASTLLTPVVQAHGIDPFDHLAVVDRGDVAFHRGRVDDMLEQAEAEAAQLAEAGVGSIVLGGEHLVTYPLLKAHAARRGPLALIQIDAHRDTKKSEHLDHGTFVRFAMEQGLIAADKSIQIGIRTHYELDDQIRVLHRARVRELGPEAVVQEIIKTTGDTPAYLSFDIDAIDPAYAPGTGTPVIDGLLPHEAIAILRGLGALDIVGMDLVEVSPPYDTSEITALLGAAIIQEFLCTRAAPKTGA